MSPSRTLWAMFRYYLNQPARTWIVLIMLTAQSVFMGVVFNLVLNQSETSGIGGSTGYITDMFGVVMAISFVAGSAGTSPSWAWILPHGEFLLSRPISRPRIYIPLLMICGCILMICPVLNVLWTIPHPDMLLSLYHDGSQSTEAWRDLASYQQAFPANSIIQLPHENHATLRLPMGSTWEALWFFWQTILLAMLVEGATLIQLQLSLVVRYRVFAALACIPAAVLLGWSWIGPHLAIEKTFFFFVHHFMLVALLTLAAFAWLQWRAWKRIEQVEVS